VRSQTASPNERVQYLIPVEVGPARYCCRLPGCLRAKPDRASHPQSRGEAVTGWVPWGPALLDRHLQYGASERPPCHPVAVLDYLGGSPKRLDVGFVPFPSDRQMYFCQREEVHSATMWTKPEGK
jgi:hypothetical protein